MGVAVTTDELPVLKQNNGLLAFGAEEAHLLEPTDCIRCGRCVAACPMNLVPAKLEKYAERKDVEMLKKLDIMTCMECGCCAFSWSGETPHRAGHSPRQILCKEGGG